MQKQWHFDIIGVGIIFCGASVAVAQQPWPAESYSNAVNLTGVEGPGANDFHVNLSGVFWNPVTRKLWACRNGGPEGSKFWVLKEDGAGGFEVDTKNGNRGEWTNFGDLEDLTQANLNEETIYLIVEGEERIKEFDVSTYGTAVLRNNWNTSPHLPLSGGSGAEGIVFVPDSYLAAAGFVDPSGNPRVSQNGMGGLMFVAHQNGGRVYVFDLNRSDSTFTYVGSYKTNFSESCALALDRSDGLLYIFHGANHNRTEVTTMASVPSGGERQFVTVTTYLPPTGSPSNSNMEGIAVVSNDDCSNNRRRFFLAIDDGGADSLFMFEQFPCTQSNPDSDGDGVFDADDQCPNTPSGAAVTTSGCSCAQLGQSGPTISSQPSSGAVCSGQTRQFCVSASGTGTLSYQWQKDGTNIGGATSACYTANAAGSYRCVVTDLCGSVTSSAATLTVNSAPSISSQPTGATICSGQTTQLCVTASGSGTLTYQWRRDGSNVSGATSSCYTANSAGSYQCIVSNACGSVTSSAAVVTVNSAPSIASQPTGGSACSGQTVQLCVTASGAGPITYQWQLNGSNIGGATSSCYSAGTAGSYRCVATNACGSTTSNSVTVTINSAPSISTHPTSGTVCSGSTRQFCVTASGSSPLSYQWQRDGVDISGATSSCFTASLAGSYRCVVTNACGSAVSNAATLTVNGSPTISSQPIGGTACSGSTYQFCVTASGAGPFTYQWQRNGVNVSGATSSCFTTGTAGTYRCVVSNSCGSTTSNSSSLTVEATMLWYPDADGDGFGAAGGAAVSGCAQPSGYVSNDLDCDDGNASVNPNASDVCGEDRNCDREFPTTRTWYRDADADGYGDALVTTSACIQPAGYVGEAGDCDDANSLVHPGATELCDGLDNDCNQLVDDQGDSDGDGVPDCEDACSGTAAGSLVDSDGCACEQLDPGDDDGDGVSNCEDACPLTTAGAGVDDQGCACRQIDAGDDDGDGVDNCDDYCPGTAVGAIIDANGCSCVQLNPADSDSDGVPNCVDFCSGTPRGEAVDSRGCSCSQKGVVDSDSDGVDDCNDLCPGTQPGMMADLSGCSCIQLDSGDSDRDGVPNCVDECPGTAVGVAVDDDGCPVGDLTVPDGGGISPLPPGNSGDLSTSPDISMIGTCGAGGASLVSALMLAMLLLPWSARRWRCR